MNCRITIDHDYMNRKNKMLNRLAAYSFLYYYPFTYSEIQQIQHKLDSIFSKSWYAKLAFNTNMKWDNRLKDLIYNHCEYPSVLTDNPNVEFDKEDICKGIALRTICNQQCKFNWALEVIEKNEGEFSWSSLSENTRMNWTPDLINRYRNKIDWECLLQNSSAMFSPAILDYAKKQVGIDDELMSKIVQKVFRPFNLPNIFNELNDFVSQYRNDLNVYSDCVVEGISKNQYIDWPASYILYGMENKLINLKALVYSRVCDGLDMKSKFYYPIAVSEDILKEHGLLPNKPATGRIALKDFWNIERFDKIFQGNLDNFMSLCENHFVLFDDNIYGYFYNMVDRSNNKYYFDMLEDISSKLGFNLYIQKKFGHSIKVFKDILGSL